MTTVTTVTTVTHTLNFALNELFLRYRAPRNAAEARERADKNPNVASYYKGKLREQDEEVKALKVRHEGGRRIYYI